MLRHFQKISVGCAHGYLITNLTFPEKHWCPILHPIHLYSEDLEKLNSNSRIILFQDNKENCLIILKLLDLSNVRN